MFAQGPIGLCATGGAQADGRPADHRRRPVRRTARDGAALRRDVTLDFHDGDPVAEIKRLTEGRGVDVAIEALGRQETFEGALRALRPGGTLSSLGVYSGKLVAPLNAFTPASATRRSSPRSAPAARSGCAG